MRRISLAVIAAALAACDGSDSKPAPAGASGTIMGSRFTPADAGALATGPAPCALPTVGTRSMATLSVGFSSFANVCGFVQTAALCGDVASSLVVSVNVANAPQSGTAAPVAPGTYQIGTFVDGSGNVVLASASIDKVDSTCVSGAGIPAVQGGSITFATTSPRVSGTVDVTFTDGSTFSGAFDVALCVATVDFCVLVNDACGTRACCSNATTCS